MVRNEAGLVAMVYHACVPKVVKLADREYAFAVKYGISLGWVEERDINTLYLTPVGCCGHSHPGGYKVATEQQVNVWKFGHYI
jgi:hypothetical protein